MKRTGRLLTCLLLAGYFAPAQAIPITFDLAGSLQQQFHTDASNTSTVDVSRSGTAFIAQVVIESDLFGPPTATAYDLGDRLSFRSLVPEAVTRSLVVGGETWDLTPFADDYAVVTAVDSLGPVCNPNCRLAPDQVNISMLSQTGNPTTGLQGLRSLSMGFSTAFTSSFEPGAGTGWFDFDEVSTLEQFLQLSLSNLSPISFRLHDSYFDCGGVQCVSAGALTTYFNVTSVTRSVASVPEPGTLALLGAGLGLSFALRRRRAPLSN